MGLILLLVLIIVISVLIEYVVKNGVAGVLACILSVFLGLSLVGIGLNYINKPSAEVEMATKYNSITMRLENNLDPYAWRDYTEFSAELASYRTAQNNWWIKWFYPIDTSPYTFDIVGLIIVK